MVERWNEVAALGKPKRWRWIRRLEATAELCEEE
jgi:hypothetical protein